MRTRNLRSPSSRDTGASSLCRSPGLRTAEVLDHRGYEVAGNGGPPLAHVGEGVRKPPRVDRLDQVAGGARAQRREEVRLLLGRRQHHDLRLGQPRGDLPGCSDATAGHSDIEQADVGTVADGRLDGACSVARLRTYVETGIRLESDAYVLSRRHVVVGDEDTDPLLGQR